MYYVTEDDVADLFRGYSGAMHGFTHYGSRHVTSGYVF